MVIRWQRGKSIFWRSSFFYFPPLGLHIYQASVLNVCCTISRVFKTILLTNWTTLSKKYSKLLSSRSYCSFLGKYWVNFQRSGAANFAKLKYDVISEDWCNCCCHQQCIHHHKILSLPSKTLKVLSAITCSWFHNNGTSVRKSSKSPHSRWHSWLWSTLFWLACLLLLLAGPGFFVSVETFAYNPEWMSFLTNNRVAASAMCLPLLDMWECIYRYTCAVVVVVNATLFFTSYTALLT